TSQLFGWNCEGFGVAADSILSFLSHNDYSLNVRFRILPSLAPTRQEICTTGADIHHSIRKHFVSRGLRQRNLYAFMQNRQ
ncbi:MAG: hypothetical protein ACYS29_02165, partial [Planctomycetota bacterium]